MRNNQSCLLGIKPLLIKLSGIPLALLICGSAFAQPANDDCDSATLVPSSAPFPPFSDSVDASTATLDPADPIISCGGNDGTQTIWWEYTPDATGVVNFSTLGSTTAGGTPLDTVIGAFTGSCAAATEVACIDSGFDDELNMEVQAGTTYYIKVGQFAGGSDAGTVEFNVLEGIPPKEPAKLVIESSFNGTSSPIRDIVGGVAASTSLTRAQAANIASSAREIPNYVAADGVAPKPLNGVSGSKVAGNGLVNWLGSAELLQVIEAGENDDNAFTLATLIAPPDTIGDVGKDHYVQMYNLLTEIYDKEGNSILGPFATSDFFAEMGGNCKVDNDGDPIVLYDEETDRWMVSQFLATSQDGLCIAISTSGDPTGSYNTYEFDFTGIGFPDYPKFGFATGALSLMVNLFNPYQGSALGVIDKEEMLAGVPATLVLFTGGEVELELFTGWIPGDNDGPVFDNFLPTFFTTLGFFDDGDTIYYAEITPDWDTPEDTTLSFGAIPVSPWDQDLCNASREACVPQPGSGTGAGNQLITYLATINDRLMHRGQIRDYGSRKVAMLNHTVDVDGNGKAGVRWYEMENKKDRGWKLKKEETFSPDSDHRWMGSIALTAKGNTCLGYSISSESTYTSIGITGRKGTSNHMNMKEVVAWDGNIAQNVQRQTVRWGDYSSMNIDPVDDTCWYTQEFAKPNSFIGERFGWGTAIIQYDVN